MPNFKEFIKGFEEKPEEEQSKTQEVKTKQPKQQPLFNDIETPEQKYSKGYAPNMTYGQAQKAYQEGKISHNELMRVWHQGGYAKKSLEQAEKHAEKYLKEKRMRPGSDPVTTPKEQWNVHQPKEAPNPKEEPLFDERLRSTKKGLEEAKNFLDAKGVKDIYTINDKQFDALADEAAKKYGIRRGLAKEFLVAPYDEEISKPQAQPKQGSFEQAFGENQQREEFSQEDKAALVATYGAFPEEGIVARKLPNGNYLTNILSGADTEPEEVDEATLSKVFDELRGEKGFEEIINEWRENPNLIRERRNVQ